MKAALVALVMTGLAAHRALAVSLPPSTSQFSVSGAGWVSEQGDIAIPSQGSSARKTIPYTTTSLPNGGKSIAASGNIGVIAPQATHYASIEGFAISQPGQLGARISGLAMLSASTTSNGPIANGWISASSHEVIPITHPTLPAGSLVEFTVSYSLSGSSSSEIPNLGPYQYPGATSNPYSTGDLSFSYYAHTSVPGSSVVLPGNVSAYYYAPDATASITSVPTSLNRSNTFHMTGKVGDILRIMTSINLEVEDRAYKSYGIFQSSNLDFSHTVNLNVDAITPGLSFIVNGYNYASVPEPASIGLFGIGTLLLLRRKPGCHALRRDSNVATRHQPQPGR
jgi:hypothetical protein